MSEEQLMGYIVKAVSAVGHTLWFSTTADGHRAFGPREQAEIFESHLDAHSAIGKMPLDFEQAGFAFHVESAD